MEYRGKYKKKIVILTMSDQLSQNAPFQKY